MKISHKAICRFTKINAATGNRDYIAKAFDTDNEVKY